MQVRLLGPVDVVVGGEPRPVHGLRRKAVLATLALQHGDLVSIDQLVDVVWGEAAPSTSRNTLQSHVSYLRTVLGDKTAIRAQPPGYVLNLPDGTDVQQVQRLVRQARQADDPTDKARQLRAALGLWRGQPLADVAGIPWLDGQAERLEMLRVDVTRALSDARLAAGEHRELIPALEQLAADRRAAEREGLARIYAPRLGLVHNDQQHRRMPFPGRQRLVTHIDPLRAPPCQGGRTPGLPSAGR
jgi:DNA-binding SARP family transcriptional activator